VKRVYINPAATISPFDLILPANPVDGAKVSIYAGGLILPGNLVVDNFSVTANQAIYQPFTPNQMYGGDNIVYEFNSQYQTWYRLK